MEKKQYYIEIDDQQIPVTEEVYRAYKQPLWAEHKRQERMRERDAVPLSFERMVEDGLDVPGGGSSLEDAVILKAMIGELHKALAELAPKDREILEFFGEGLSDRKISAATGMPQTTVSYRKKILLKKLREKMKNYF